MTSRYFPLTAVVFLALAFSANAALITSDTIISAGDTNYDGQDLVVLGCTLTIDGPHTFSDVLVIEGGTIMQSETTTNPAAGVNLTVSNNVIIEGGSSIIADGLGFGPGAGPGAGQSLLTNSPFGFSFTSGGGGGFGGNGAASFAGAAGGASYGLLEFPTNAGSGGGTGLGSGGAGGGMIVLNVGGALVVDGQISANGSSGTNPASGGGSGGGIWITAPAISGTGSILANGGEGEPSNGGGGGGGQIAIYYSTNDFAGTIAADGGAGAMAGGAGTIYSQLISGSEGQVTVDNGGMAGATTPLSPTNYTSLTISGGAVAYFTSGDVGMSNLLIGSNSWLVSPMLGAQPYEISVAGNATIQTNGGIDFDAVAAAGGPGEGQAGYTNGDYFGGGGSYGGSGGAGYGARSDGTYGTINQPTSLGSSGGLGNGSGMFADGGAGGGAIELTVGGTLTNNGVISANGGEGIGDGSGGGSGGSIYLITGSVRGSGTLSANGGNAGSSLGGGGGGGRIAVFATNTSFAVTAFAHGGTGYVNGGAGTIYLSPLGQGYLVLDNGGLSGTNTSVPNMSLTALTVTNGAVGTVTVGLSSENLFIGSNSFLNGSGGEIFFSIQSNVIVSAGGGIILDGDSGQNGPEAFNGGGGGHGGAGGSSARNPGGPAETDLLGQPNETGTSGGGGVEGAFGGAGGGYFHLSAGGSLVLNGTISANGLSPLLATGAGGGAGGTIFISAGVLSGNGVLAANGGAGDSVGGGGGGGGGRIAIYYASSNKFDGTISAHGGSGFGAGGAGTIYVAPSYNQAMAAITVDNGGLIGTNTPLTGLTSGEYNLTVANGADGVFPSGNSFFLANLLITTNASISSTPIEANLELTISSNVTIQAGGSINLDGSGYPGGEGAEDGAIVFFGEIESGGGGGNGGAGGTSAYGARGGNPSPYNGDAPPASGGGDGGAGGGALTLNVTGILTVNGTISANGASATNLGGGGGAGGAISLTAGSFAGTGTISANGGASQGVIGGGGGGGLIGMTAKITNQFAGIISAQGGNGAMAGGAGVITEEAGPQAQNEVIMDNGGLSGAETAYTTAAQPFDLTVTNGAKLGYGFGSVTVSGVRNIVIASNSFIYLTNTARINPLGNVTILPGGGMIADGGGYAGGVGPGSGGETTSSLIASGGGAGHGGSGGKGETGAAGGQIYDGISDPQGEGSGGGDSGGAGGGAIELSMQGGTLTIGGVLSANGTAGTNANSGGGSGGSIWINAKSVTGNGVISATGGAGQMPYGGGGGGGMIAIYTSGGPFTGTAVAHGGSGYANGGAGTIYLSYEGQAQVIVDNGGLSGTNTTVSLGNVNNFVVTSGAIVTIGTELTVQSLFIGPNSFVTGQPGNFILSVSSNATVAAGGGIILDGDGAPENAAAPGAGAGHGGAGGSGAENPGQAADDTVQSPEMSGSPGGTGTIEGSGGAGGASLHLSVNGLLTLNGIISANGLPGEPATSAGGGAGGAIWFNVGGIAGNGAIAANGGAGDGLGGGGGGGRIAIYSASNSFAGTISAHGAAGFVAGGAGTVFVAANNSQIVGTVTADNGGLIGTNTPFAALPGAGCNLTVANGADAFITPVSQIFMANLLITTNAVLSWSRPAMNFELSVASNATIQAGGSIYADGLGSILQGGGILFSNGIESGGGGGNAGLGGRSAYGASGASANTDAQVQESGSLGGNGGVGGGAITLTVGQVLTLNGTISANGFSPTNVGGGGGGGGGIAVTAGSISGGGRISANGGAGQGGIGGGGGGGIITLTITSTNLFAGSITAYGGVGANAGGAGIIEEKFGPQAVLQITANNDGISGANSYFSNPDQTFDLFVTNGARLGSSGEYLVLNNFSDLRNLWISSNSFIFVTNSPGSRLEPTGNVTILAGGGLEADGMGYPGLILSGSGEGPGGGQTLTSGGVTSGGGGGHGGSGGMGGTGAAGGGCYDSIVEPELVGSSGGGGGGAGGGALELLMQGGTLTVNGILSANGLSGTNSGSGGGSGGSLLLTARTLAGGGIISANGGSGKLPLGGGGGGGRVLITTTGNTNSFTGSITAYGGAGYAAGGAGTVESNALQQNYQLVVDNGGASGATTVLTMVNNSPALTIRGGAVASLTQGQLGSLLIGPNSALLGTNRISTELTVTGNATIQPGGSIILDGDGQGSGGVGSGGNRLSTYGYFTGGGGGYGGNGGNSESGATGGTSFGALAQPTSLGGGGGPGTGNEETSAAGGGALQLMVGGTLEIDGIISANGAVATNEAAGGGSGGSVWLTAAYIAGAGSISANGAAGDLPNGGGGGGGRIALSSKTNGYTGTITAFGGRGFVSGGAGTICLASVTANSPPLVIVDNGGLSGADTPVAFPLYVGLPNATYGVTVSGGAMLTPVGGVGVLESLLVESNGAITLSNAPGTVDLTVFGNAMVASNSAIIVDGMGYNAATPGPGAGTAATNNGEGSGGGYGGAGGASAAGTPGGATYGSSEEPANWGSAGGVFSSLDPNLSQGGGAIELSVGGTLTINGNVSANGVAGIFPGSGGGAGGSVWLTAATLAGDGTISANGGAGQDNLGGGGGGGRISISALTNGFDGAVTASGGSGFAAGQTGTIYISNSVGGPNVIAQTPSGAITNAPNVITLTFDSPISPTSLSISNVTITTPSGVLKDGLSLGLVGDDELEIEFPLQTNLGNYSFEVGQVQDIYGVPMAAPYIGTFSIVAPAVQLSVTPTAQGGSFNLLWNGAAGASYQVESSSDLVHWQPFGGVMTGSNGVNSIVLLIGADPGTYFRLVPAN